ncbi:MAG: hypothetical protein CMP59_06225 [Flavobacteriales bacterium]|nr:hypothetical protein [Flavobacteriales bacterium]|tara:strand:+ start:476 stop:904 length:429 start_codon:yes stop_codon:yes gene_type:complete
MTKANLFVLLQLTLILLLFLECRPIASFPLIIIQLLGVLIGLWAILQFEFRNLAISPLPREEGKLVTSGPYKWIRNPMYLAVLLYCLALVIEAKNLIAVFLYLGLFTLLHLKLNYEEGLLKKKYPDYADYCKRSKKLIPFIY